MLSRSNKALSIGLAVAIAVGAPTVADGAEKKVDLNTASVEEMKRALDLPFLSKEYAAIVAWRDEHGQCASVAKLAQDKVISQPSASVMETAGFYCGSASEVASASTASSSSARTQAPTANDETTYNAYKKLNSTAGWVEYLLSNPPPTFATRGHVGLASRLEREEGAGVKLGTMSQVKCKGGTLTQSQLIDHMGTIGSKWEYYCDQGSFTYTVVNPTAELLFIRGSVYGVKIEHLLDPGKSATATAKMKSACTSGEVRYAPGKVTFGCRAEMDLQAAGPVAAELAAYPDILTTEDVATLSRFTAEFPGSALTKSVDDRRKALEKAYTESVRSQLKVSVALGPEPALLIDPRSYTLTLENTSNVSVTFRVEHEKAPGNRGPELTLAPGESKVLELVTNSGKEPNYQIGGFTVTQ